MRGGLAWRFGARRGGRSGVRRRRSRPGACRRRGRGRGRRIRLRGGRREVGAGYSLLANCEEVFRFGGGLYIYNLKYNMAAMSGLCWGAVDSLCRGRGIVVVLCYVAKDEMHSTICGQ